MAKRRNLKDTLRKERATKTEQEPVLAKKVALPKPAKDITKIAEQADTIHQEELKPVQAKTIPTPTSPAPIKKVEKAEIVGKKVIKKVVKKEILTPEVVIKERVTVWLPKHLLKTLKIHLATEEKKITEYFTELVKKDLKIK